MKPTGTVSFLFADIVASGVEDRNSSSHETGVDRFGTIINEIVIRNHGLVYRTSGYRYCCAFVLPLDAVMAASHIQSRLGAGHTVGESAVFRMAVHTGEAKECDGNYSGNTINRVLHLLSLARPGEVLISNSVETLVTEFLPEDLRFVALPYSRESTYREHVLQLRRQSEEYYPSVRIHPVLPYIARHEPPTRVKYARRRVSRVSVPVGVPAH